MSRMPAVIIGNQGQSDITDFRFSGQFRFLQIGHPDDVHAPTTIDFRFCNRGKCRTFHTQIGPPQFHRNACFRSSFDNLLRKMRADRVGKTDMNHQALSKKGRNSSPSPIKKLVWEDDIKWFMFLFQGSDCTRRDNPLHSNFLHGINIGSEVELRRQDPVPFAMPCQKGHSLPFQCANGQRVGGIPKRGLHAQFLNVS